MTVVQFPRQDEDKIVWRCNCGSLTHYLRADGEMECTVCKTLAGSETGDWRKHLPPTPAQVAETQDGDIVTTDLNSADIAIRRALKTIDPETLSGLFIILKDGKLRVWTDVHTEAQEAWLNRRLDDARASIALRG